MIQQRVRVWTEDEDNYIKENFLNMSDSEMSEKLQRSEHAVRTRRNLHKLIRPRKRSEIKNKPNKKVHFEDAKKLFEERGYILLSDESEYKNQASKLRYNCPKHLDKGELLIDYGHLRQGRGCYYCGRERTEIARRSKVTVKEDIELCKTKGFEYIRTEKKDDKYVIFFYCPKHRELGEQYMTRGNMNREEVQGCQYCSGKNLPHSYIREKIENKYPFKVLSEYNGMNNPLKCYCNKHNKEFTRQAKSIFYKGVGCEDCTYEKHSNAFKLTDDLISNRIHNANPDLDVISLERYSEKNRYVKVRCEKCGYTWDSPYSSIIVNHTSCPNCSPKISNGESKLIEILYNKNYNYSPQYKIPECKYKYSLPFDNALLDSDNKLICLFEYQGEQHYKPIKYFGGEEKFKETKLRDQIKKDFCQEHNIPLLIIPYWEYNNMENLVDDFINNIA